MSKIKLLVRKILDVKLKLTKRKRAKMYDDKLCVIPWVHLNFEPDGKVVPCCLTSPHGYYAGDLKTQSIQEIWNSSNMKKLRVQMLNGEEPKICNRCFQQEKVTGESSRIHRNSDFPEAYKKIRDITEPDGTVEKMDLKYWDFRFSNLCNFKCRSCGPRYSSAWIPDSKKMGNKDQEKVWNIESVNDEANYDFLKEQINTVEKIYFAGGEPLLMPEHWQILDMLVEHKKFNVRVSYNTNGSILTYGNKNVLDYWSQWEQDKLEVWPSIDEIGPRAELIRSGTNWEKVESNLLEMAKLGNIIIRPGITVSAMNVFRLPEIITHLAELGIIKEKFWYKNFFLNLLIGPQFYHVSVLPDEFKKEIIIKLTNFIEDYNKKYSTNISSIFTQILHELEKPQVKKEADAFVSMSSLVDNIRNENIFEIIPELSVLKV